MNKFRGFPPMNANFTPVPNAFFDHVLPNCPPCVVSVVGAIIRATLGWTDSVTGEKRIEAELSIPDIARMARIAENSARKGVRQALEEGLLIETAAAGLNTGARYALRWEDEDRQKVAIERARKATDSYPAPPSKIAPPSKVEPLQLLTPSKVEPLIKERDSQKKKDTDVSVKKALNVRSDVDAAPGNTTFNEGGRGIYAIRDKAVAELVALTGDEGSLRRFQQLWEIAEGKGALNAWDAALRATRRRLAGNAKQALDRPGAYFDKICVQELEKREVFVPTISEKLAEGDVRETIRLGLGSETKDEAIAPKDEKELPKYPAKGRETKAERRQGLNRSDRPENLLLELEQLGGKALEEFEAFVSIHRESYKKELGTMGPTARERLLATFERPQKRLDLFLLWSTRPLSE